MLLKCTSYKLHPLHWWVLTLTHFLAVWWNQKRYILIVPIWSFYASRAFRLLMYDQDGKWGRLRHLHLCVCIISKGVFTFCFEDWRVGFFAERHFQTVGNLDVLRLSPNKNLETSRLRFAGLPLTSDLSNWTPLQRWIFHNFVCWQATTMCLHLLPFFVTPPTPFHFPCCLLPAQLWGKYLLGSHLSNVEKCSQPWQKL